VSPPSRSSAPTSTNLFPGGHFLVHHVDGTVGDQPVRVIEIIGEPDGGGGYLARSFDSLGDAEAMHVTIDPTVN
jgi:hypothetical protein